MLRTEDKIIATNVEFANSTISKVRGLMFRKSIDPDFALIFPLSKPRKVSVHMHFVRFPIDVMLLDGNKKVVQIATLQAGKGKLKSDSDVKYVIEMAAGSITDSNIFIGEKLFF